MARKTSAISYDAIKESGMLGRLQFSVYDCLYHHGPLTQGEIWSKHFPEYQRHSIAPRLAELESRGVACVVGERECHYSGQLSLLWDVTENLPVKPPPRKTKNEIIEELTESLKEKDGVIDKLRGIIKDLRDEIVTIERVYEN